MRPAQAVTIKSKAFEEALKDCIINEATAIRQ
jgi:hypothetical protein